MFLSFPFFLFWHNMYSVVHLTMGSSTYTFNLLMCSVNEFFLIPFLFYLRPWIFIPKLQLKGWALWSAHFCTHRALDEDRESAFLYLIHCIWNRGDPIPAGACPQASATGRYYQLLSRCYLPSLETGTGSRSYGWRTAYLWHCYRDLNFPLQIKRQSPVRGKPSAFPSPCFLLGRSAVPGGTTAMGKERMKANAKDKRRAERKARFLEDIIERLDPPETAYLWTYYHLRKKPTHSHLLKARLENN